MLKKWICILLALCIVAGFAGCAGEQNVPEEQESSTESQSESSGDVTSDDPGEESGEEPEDEEPAPEKEKYTDVTFSGLPESDAPFVKLYPGKGTVLFEYVLPGLDSSESTLVQYSLTEDKVLGKAELGSGVFSVRNHEDGSFTVFDANSGEGRTYGPDGSASSATKITCITGGLGFIAQGDKGDPVLVGELSTGDLYLVQQDGTTKSKIQLDPGYYEVIGFTEGEYIVSKEGRTIYAIDTDGNARKVFSAGANPVTADGWVAGQQADYLSFMPLKQGDMFFTLTEDQEESLSSAGDGCFVTLARKQGSTDIRLYRMSDLTRSRTSVQKEVEASAVLETGQIAAVFREGNNIKCQLLDPDESWERKAVTPETDLSAVLGFTALPEIGSKDDTDAYTKQVQEKNHIRFLYEPCEMLDALAEMDLKGELPSDRARILYVEKKIVEGLSFLPDAVWNKLGGDLPFVIVLCERLSGNLEGFSFDYGGYNVIFMELNGEDSYILHLFYHELGHAISRIAIRENPAFASEWIELTPSNVRKAVELGTADGKNALTVEFTPDDKKGNVCYVSTYAMTNPEEDRAETLAAFRDAYLTKDQKLFSHEVLKKKAQKWGEMIRTAFGLGEGTALPFDEA